MSYLWKQLFLGLPHIVKAASETWPNPRVKVNSTLAQSFQQKPCSEKNVMPSVNFALSDCNDKDQLRDLYNYLNQKVKTAINTYDCSTLGNNLITSYQVILCPQRSFQLKLLKINISILQQIRQVVSRHQFSNYLCLRNHSYASIQCSVKTLSLNSLWRRISRSHVFNLVS